MTGNAGQVNPLFPNFQPYHDVDDIFEAHLSSENVTSNSLGDRSLFSESTRTTSSARSPEIVGYSWTNDWRSHDNFPSHVMNSNGPEAIRLDPYLPDLTMDHEQQPYVVDQNTSFNGNGAIGDMSFAMTFGTDCSALPAQFSTETIEENQRSLEPFNYVNAWSDLDLYADPSDSTVAINQLFVDEQPLSGNGQTQYSCQQGVFSSIPPSIPFFPSVREIDLYSQVNPAPASDLSRSLPIREADTPICKKYKTKTSKGQTALGRPRSTSLTYKAGRGGRTKRLSDEGRINYQKVRKVRACDNCHHRKYRCDDSILCKACVRYFGANLVYNRCRQFSLNDVTGILLDGKMSWHPGKRNLSTYFSNFSFEIGTEEFIIPLKIGFGEPMREAVRIISPGDIDQLYHHHVVYQWPPQGGDQKKCERSLQLTFPAELSHEQGLRQRIDKHVTVLLLKHFKNFSHFPSDLNLLREIYKLYISLLQNKQSSNVLHKALKLLIVVRVSGEVTVDESDPSAQKILEKALNTPLAAYKATHPCFIRSQLGGVFSELARALLSDILIELETLTLKQDCSEWHIVFSTFAVLLMTVELVQYQDARIGFHAALDGNLLHSPAFNFFERSQEVDKKGVDSLLHFFRVCFGRCNSRIQDEFSPVPPGQAGQFLAKIREIYNRMQPYLKKRSASEVGNGQDMSHLLDRLVSRMFLIRPTIS